MKKTKATPRDLLVDQIAILAKRAIERVAERHCTPDEWAQLAPYVEREINRRRELAKRNRK
ncbi:MAG TPA: hypothetical protein VFA28_01925 [Bryobacteraceae bacterium]|nr:hypothetical protein [Bryobacteraceae bacterium]